MTNSNHLEVTCPYCKKVDPTDLPQNKKKPDELECMPYTRDIGRFDSPKKGWSSIGKDYHAWFKYESIGILRIHTNMDIQYRVKFCPSCKKPFDVYANYSGTPLKILWPHIFGSDPDHPKSIKPYYGNSWIIWLIRGLGRIVKHNSVSAIIIGLIILSLSFLPWLFTVQQDHGSQLSLLLKITLLIRTLVVIGVIASLILIDNYVRFFEKNPDFEKLFRIRQKRGLIHWRNFTLCRLVGVQDSHGLPHLTQIDAIIGGLTILTIFPTWIIVKIGWIGILYWLAGLIAVFLLDLLLFKLKKKFKKLHWLKHSRSIIFLLLLSLALAWGLIKWVSAPLFMRWDNINAIFDILFWIIAFYIFGTLASMAINSSIYILKGLSKIPMNLSPYTGFLNSRPLRKIQKFSSSMLIVFSISLVAIVSILIIFRQSIDQAIFKQMLSGPNWILNFMFFVVGAIIISLGISSGRKAFIYITFVYFVAILLTSGTFLIIGSIKFDGPLITLGIFFTSIMVYQFFSTDNIIRKILKEEKEKALHELSELIEHIRKKLIRINSNIFGSLQNKPLEQAQYKRMIAVVSLVKLTNIIKSVEKTPVLGNLTKRIFEFIGPLMIAILAQFLSNIF